MDRFLCSALTFWFRDHDALLAGFVFRFYPRRSSLIPLLPTTHPLCSNVDVFLRLPCSDLSFLGDHLHCSSSPLLCYYRDRSTHSSENSWKFCSSLSGLFLFSSRSALVISPAKVVQDSFPMLFFRACSSQVQHHRPSISTFVDPPPPPDKYRFFRASIPPDLSPDLMPDGTFVVFFFPLSHPTPHGSPVLPPCSMPFFNLQSRLTENYVFFLYHFFRLIPSLLLVYCSAKHCSTLLFSARKISSLSSL